MSEEQAILDALNEVATPADAPAPQDTAPVEAAPPAVKAPVQLEDDVPVEYKLNGQVVRKPWKEILQTQALLPGDYTRKTQALAAERTAFHEERTQFEQLRQQFEQERQALGMALRDPKKIEALYLAAVAAQQQQPPVGQPPQAVDPTQLSQTILQTVEQRMQARFQELEESRINANRADSLEKHVSSILDANPSLKALPNINDYLYGQVISMVEPGKTTVQEAQQMLDLVAQEIASKLNEHFTQSNKQAAVQQSQLKNGIEPKGGAPVLPKAKQYNKKKGLDDPDMEADVLAYVKAQLGGG